MTWKPLTRDDVAAIAREARALVAAHERRADGETGATLNEREALERLTVALFEKGYTVTS